MNFRKIAALLAAVTITSAFSACNSDKKDSSSSSEASEPSQETTQAPTEAKEDNSIKWFGCYDLNPVGGNDRSIALTLFEEFYDGKIEWVPTTNDTKYDDLSKLVLGGEKIDMVSFEPETYIQGIGEGLYQSLDDYIDLDSDLWKDMKSTADTLAYKGKHYAVPYSIEDPICVIYSRKIMKDEKLDDPAELYKQGKWDWDAFSSLMDTFTDNGSGRYGCAGWLGQALVHSTGQTMVTYNGTSFQNNLANPDIEKAEKFMSDLAAAGNYNDSWQTYFPENGNTLFLVQAPWALEESNGLNPDKDIAIVPFPKMTGSGNYYSSCGFGAKLLAAGSDKGAAVAHYLECERMAATEEEYKKLAKEVALRPVENFAGEKSRFITSEQYDMVQEICDPSKVVPLYDYGIGMGKKMSGDSINFDDRGAIKNLTDGLISGYDGSPGSWEALRDAYTKTVDDEIKNYN